MTSSEDEILSCLSWFPNVIFDSLSWVTKKPCGLRNTLEGCYMYSVSQAVASSDMFTEELKRLQFINPNSSGLNLFLDLLHGINKTTYSATNIKKNTKLHEDLVKETLMKKEYEKDVFKWFAGLMKAIEDQINTSLDERIKMPMNVKLVQRCKGLDISDELQDQFGISLKLCGDYLNNPGVTLEFLISNYFLPQSDKDDPSKPYQRYFYKDAPNILFIHILEYEWDTLIGQTSNPKYHIEYQEQMTLRLDIVTELNTERMKRGSFHYRICSIIQCSSDTPKRKKVLYRRWRNDWYFVNNLQIKKVEFRKVSCPYILIYEREKEKVSEIPPSGLKNTSSTCYMNSMVQAAASSDVLIDQLEKLQSAYSQSQSLKYLLRLLHGINEGNDISVNTELLEKLVEEVHWNKPSEQDAFQLFSALINGIHKEIKSTLSEPFQMPPKIKLVHRFQGMDFKDKIQDHLGLSLGLYGNYSERPGVKLESLIHEHFQPTIIDGDPSKSTQMVFYKEAPDILLLHIQANKWDDVKGEMYKPEYYIDYNEEMTIKLSIATDVHTTETTTESYDYTLRGLVHHMGNVFGGHYITYRICNGSWYLLNDIQVAKVPFSNSICPYILIYEKKPV